jgi:endonuclease-3
MRLEMLQGECKERNASHSVDVHGNKGVAVKQANAVLLQEGLIAKALDGLSRPPVPVPFAVKVEADQLVKDITGHPHAFVIACVMDRVGKAEKAWGVPYELQQRLGSFEFPFLLQKSLPELEYAMKEPTSLHWLNNVMPRNMYDAIRRISDVYDGNAAAIWAGRPTSASVVYRFLQFRGIGPKIANMAANILFRDLRVEFADTSSIDISADSQVMRVFSRMGFVPQNASVEDVIFRARDMYPKYPGIFDLILWDLGRTLCRPTNPACSTCEWSAECLYANTDHASSA